MITALSGSAVAIATTVNAPTFIVKTAETFFIEETPGLRVCLTTTTTLEVVSASQIAWEMGLGGHTDEDVEVNMLMAIYNICGYCVPMSVMSWA